MTNDEALALVIELACLTEDRSGEEQRALIDVALALDLKRGTLGTVTNKDPKRPTLTRHVVETYGPDGLGNPRRPVGLTAPQEAKLAGLEQRWAEHDEKLRPRLTHDARCIDPEEGTIACVCGLDEHLAGQPTPEDVRP